MPSVYGVLISLGILSCALVAEKLAQKDKQTVWSMALWGTIGGILGARLYHVVDFIHYYSQKPLEILAIWKGGLGIWGAIFGGMLAIYIYLKNNNKNIPYWLAIAAVVTPLGQAIGRIGNFFNMELYGKPTQLPWGINVGGLKVHPLFLYESILNFALFLILLRLYKARTVLGKNGLFVGIYLIGYSLIRTVLEFYRVNPWKIAGLNVAQSISIIVITLSLVFIFRKDTKS